MTIPILLVDDHRGVLDALRVLINRTDDLRVVGETAEADRVLGLVDKLEPRVVLLDVKLANSSGLDLLPQLKARHPALHILMLSMYADESYARRALQTGAEGYVLKQASVEELLRAIRAVVRGERFVGSGLSLERLAELEEHASTLSTDPFDRLTEREREVARLAARGLTSEAIAAQLSIGRRTVETHRANLSRKLGITSTAQLVRLVLRREGTDR